MDETNQYEEELRQMNEAIKLQKELQALLELTEQNENASTSTSSKYDNHIADEMALFMSEIKNIENTSEGAKKCVEDNDEFELHLEVIKSELKAMMGKKCSAPHQHSWGTKTYHNAIICGLDDSKNYDLDDIKNFRLRILFTNPTHREMIPCSYYLEGDCRFDVDKCRYSHGELISFGELKEYQEPEFSKLKRNCVVLAKMNDKLWHKGRVLNEDFEQKICKVRIDDQKKEIDFNFEDLFPIFQDDDLSSGSSSDSENSIDYFDKFRHAKLVEQSLLNPAPTQALGEWEKYTKGIGSKLMQKMGYVIGTGLGTNGEGIIIPVSAQVLPPGRSLDHCMELREAANGDQNLFNVERKMKTAQKRQEALSAKAYERASNKTDLFSFLNDNIFSKQSNSNIANNSNKIVGKTKNNDYKNHTTKNLNVESVKIADDIRKMEREISKVKDSMKRHSNSSEIYKKLNRTLDVKNQELNLLRKSEISLEKEQISRKHKDKLIIF